MRMHIYELRHLWDHCVEADDHGIYIYYGHQSIADSKTQPSTFVYEGLCLCLRTFAIVNKLEITEEPKLLAFFQQEIK